MAAAQDLFATQHVAERVESIENDLQQVDEWMRGLYRRVQGVGYGVKGAHDRISVAIDGERILSGIWLVLSISYQPVSRPDIGHIEELLQQMAVDIGDQKRGLSHISPILVVGAQIPLQKRNADGSFQDGSRPRTHLLITILQAVHVTRALRYGSFKAAPSRTGRSLPHCCGYTENVHIPAAVSSPLLTTFVSTAGAGKSVLTYVTLQSDLS